MSIKTALFKSMLRLFALLLIAIILIHEEHIPHLPHEETAIEITEGDVAE